MKRVLLLGGALGLGLAALNLPREGALELGPSRLEEAEGIVVLRSVVFRGEQEAGSLVALYVDLSRWEPAIVPNDGRPLSELEPTAAAVVNGSFFTPEARPTGLLVSGGDQLHPFVSRGGAAGSGVLTVDDEVVALHPRRAFEPRPTRFAVQAGPRILEAGGARGIRADDGARANRTAIGAIEDGRLAIVVVHGRDGGHGLGLTLFELQQVLERLSERHPALSWAIALNLDGGASTGLWVSTPPVQLGESTPVPYAIALRDRSAP